MSDWKTRTEWFRQAGWGVMIHYLSHYGDANQLAESYSADEWNRRVDAVDVEKLAMQLEEIEAGYLLYTIGQCSGFYCAPNQTYDDIVGHNPARTSRRDLISDLANALAKRGIRLMAYLPCHAPLDDRRAVRAFRFIPPWKSRIDEALHFRNGGKERLLAEVTVDDRLSFHGTKWETVIREWSLRWGRKVSGWWIDGVYHADQWFRHPDAPNFKSFAAALRAGNPESILAFAQGPFPWVHSWFDKMDEEEDYYDGETNVAFAVDFRGGFAEKQQTHTLNYLGDNWSRGNAPRFRHEFVREYTRLVIDQRAAVTWETPITRDSLIPEPFMEQLRELKTIPAACRQEVTL